jgi:hypothetical protein
MSATTVLTIEKGVTFRHRLIWRDRFKRNIDMTGYSARLQIKNDAGTVLLLEMATGTGEIVITPAKGLMELELSAGQTAALAFAHGVFDLFVTAPDGTVIRLLKGKLLVVPGVL